MKIGMTMFQQSCSHAPSLSSSGTAMALRSHYASFFPSKRLSKGTSAGYQRMVCINAMAEVCGKTNQLIYCKKSLFSWNQTTKNKAQQSP